MAFNNPKLQQELVNARKNPPNKNIGRVLCGYKTPTKRKCKIKDTTWEYDSSRSWEDKQEN